MSDSVELVPRRFVPFRCEDIVALLLQENNLSEENSSQFTTGLDQIQEYFQQEFYTIKQQLKNAYAPLDPDRDTRSIKEIETPSTLDQSKPLTDNLQQVLNRANYEQVNDENLQKALNSSSLFQVRLFVDINDFEEVLLYTRGASRREVIVPEFFGLWKRKVRFTNYDRVVLYIRLKENIDDESALGECPGGSTLLKLFQNVPAADLEMLFPNIRVGMRFVDKLMIGVPAIVSGAVVVSTKLGATLLLLASLFGFWLGVSDDPVELDKAALIAVMASLVALGGYLWKQLSNFRNRKLKYTQALTENLYFKLLDNNAGVIFRILDDAEEAEVKESVLAYYFLLLSTESVTAEYLDTAIQTWFEERWQCAVNFEIDDALDKLQKLSLATCNEGEWRALIG